MVQGRIRGVEAIVRVRLWVEQLRCQTRTRVVTPHRQRQTKDHQAETEEADQDCAVVSSGNLIGSVDIFASRIRRIREMRNVTSDTVSRRKFFSENTVLTT
jgi:hypothetical protein